MLFTHLTLTRFLSFGPDATRLTLEPITILVGPNGAGKSNLIQALNLLRHAPTDMRPVLSEGGGVRAWFWRDPEGGRSTTSPSATVEVTLNAGAVAEASVRYQLDLSANDGRLAIINERIEDTEPQPGHERPYFYYGHENGHPTLNIKEQTRRLRREDIDEARSILAQRKDPEFYPELTRLGRLLSQIRVYQSFTLGPASPLRASCRADVPNEVLDDEKLDNLPARMAVLKRDPPVKRRLQGLLSEVSPGFEDLDITPDRDGNLRLTLTDGHISVPAARLSDGTLRYLMLLAILLDPEPPPLIVIEEPELALHPDVLPVLRDLVLEASTRTQLILTTQSPAFLDAWTDHPHCVVVCERVQGATRLRRLDPASPSEEGEGLGSRWLSGELGGTRW